MGRWIYYLLFRFSSLFARVLTNYQFQANIRNSFYQKYFQFLKSDLDLSVLLNFCNNIPQKCRQLNSIFRINPLIKEINFYYAIEPQVSLQNYYEYLRDPSLKHITKNPSVFSQDEKFVFLLRMYVSNHQNISRIDQRTFNKFQYYFSLCNLSFSRDDRDNILDQILMSLAPALRFAAKVEVSYFLEANRNKIKFENIYQNSKNPEILIALFPQNFYFLNLDINKIPTDLAAITLLQLNWELWGLSTQPQLHDQQLHYLKNFKNLQLMLQKMNLNSQELLILKENTLLQSQVILEKLF